MFATARLQLLAQRARPTAASRTRLLPVLPPLAALLPVGGLRRGTVVRCTGRGAVSLALAVAAGPSAAGSWCATVGMDQVGVLAAAGYGLDLGRLVVVHAAAAEWAVAAAALVDGVDLVMLVPPRHAGHAAARTLAARVRDRGAVVLVVEERPRFPAELELAVEAMRWHGLAKGVGRLQSRRVTVVASGRGSAIRPVHQELWLPTATGKVAAA
ncbi:MAG: hypothetical protein ACRDXC_03645 [Acidimicrobiales bacterium]